MDEQSTAVNTEVQDQNATGSAPAEQPNTEVEATQADQGEQPDSGEQPEVQPEGGEQPEQTDQESPAERRKVQLNSEIRELANQRRALRQEIESLHAQVYKPANVQELMNQVNPATGEYYTPVEAEVAAMRQEQQIRSYNDQVAENRIGLMTEATEAIRDYPMFDSQSEEYKNLPNDMKQVVMAADRVLEGAKIVDQNTGEIIGSNISPYSLYQAIGEAYAAGQSAGSIKGQQSTANMLARADGRGSSGPQKDTPFANLSAAQMRERLIAKGHIVT